MFAVFYSICKKGLLLLPFKMCFETTSFKLQSNLYNSKEMLYERLLLVTIGRYFINS